jgi:C-terminal processing protease CtpA/Prc
LRSVFFFLALNGQVRVGDFVIEIDGVPIKGWELENVKQLTIGEGV